MAVTFDQYRYSQSVATPVPTADAIPLPEVAHRDTTTALRQIQTNPPTIPALAHLPHAESESRLMPVPTHPADAAKSCFRDVFRCPGRDFGSPSRGVEGISDNNQGVQWNAGYHLRDGAVWLGVNLEGMQYDDWPVARLIEREISRPLLLNRYRGRVARPDKVTVRWTRDAWQVRSRPPIRERYLDPTPLALDRLDDQGWAEALREARDCLDPERHHRGRRRVAVTLLPSRRRVVMPVTSHLAFETRLATISPYEMRQARDNLEALHEFVDDRSRPYER